MKKIVYLFLLVGYFGYSQFYKFENDELKEDVKSLELFILKDNNSERLVEHKTFDKKGRILTSKIYNSDNKRIISNERNQYLGNQIITEFCECDDLDKVFADFTIKKNEDEDDSNGIVYATADRPKRIDKHYKTIDKNGNIISSKRYSSDGYFSWETKSTYDENSNLLLEETFDYSGKKTKDYKKNTYNAKGFLIETDSYYEGKAIFKYDNLDRKIFEKRFYETSTPETVFEYDNLGRIISEKHNNNFETVYEYINKKDTIKVVKFHIDSEKNKYVRNIKKSYNKGKNKVTEEHSFDEKGERPNIRIFEYDANKNLISSKYSNSLEYAENREIVYDKKGNWVELQFSRRVKVGYNGSEPKSEWQTVKYIRKIQYH